MATSLPRRSAVAFLLLWLASLLLAVSAQGVSSGSKFDVQETFHVSVVGSFRQDAPTQCTYCDGSNSWVDSVSCPSMGITEPDDNQQRWGVCNTAWGTPCNCFDSSGVGFRGVTNVTIVSNPADGTPTKIGRMTHYNNQISGTSPTQLRLTIQMSAPELSQPFTISYPLNFIETPNMDIKDCDPVIQMTDIPCDDRFSFSDISISDTFTRDNTEYTLQIVGFVRDNTASLTPIKGFVTEESTVNFADVYARIVTACVVTDCPENQAFMTPPVCGCVCVVSDMYCQEENGGNPYWKSVNETCSCQCTLKESDCPANSTFDAASCSCGCPLTNADCTNQFNDEDFVVSPDPTLCGCVCSSKVEAACQALGRFWQTSSESCDCYCAVTDALCEEVYGDGYTADASSCGCSSGGGLSGGEIAGIAVGAAVGACLLATLFLALAGLLAYLIRRGAIPGIYGVKIDDPGFEGASHSPLYHDPWKGNENLLRS